MLRVIDDKKGNVGVLKLEEALKAAEEAGVDLIEIVPSANPPVAKLMDYGKYLYQENKKLKKNKAKAHKTETKTLQIKLATGEHDLDLKAKQASKFLSQGHRMKIDLFLAGRAKYLEFNFLKERLGRVLHLITEKYKIVDGPKKGPKGLTIIIEKA